jgi:hypothetical protein
LYVASHAGHNGESHNHNDIGDFLVYDEGFPVIIDAGAGTYTSKTFSNKRYSLWFNTSSYHNLPTINQKEQSAGKNYKATNVSYLNNDSIVYFSMDIAKAWDATAGLNKWNRKLVVDRKKTISIVDDFEMDKKPTSITQTFMTTCFLNIEKPGRIIFEEPNGRKVFLTYDETRWKVSYEKIRLSEPEDKKMLVTWEGRDIIRILLTNTSLEQKGKMVFTVSK